MSFDLESFKLSLAPFGILTYATIFNQGLGTEYLEFVVDSVNYLYAVANFGAFTIDNILPYYSNLVIVSMDKIRLKGVFKKN